MNHGSLFSGIGGFDLAAEWMGWENVFHCEWNEFGQRVLKYYWPNAISYDDITKTDFTIHRGSIDILTGGFPCQPYSTAGKRKGKEDDRHLWPEMLRAIREIAPKYVVGENVSGLLSWNGGLVFEEVQADLEAEGYEVQPVLLPACGIGAPHKRERVWFVAYSPSNRWKREGKKIENENRKSGSSEIGKLEGGFKRLGESRIIANSERKRQSGSGRADEPLRTKTDSEWKASWAYDDDRWPTQSPVCSRDDGISRELDGITFSKWLQGSISGYGNAIVPELAFELFKAIEQTKYSLNL